MRKIASLLGGLACAGVLATASPASALLSLAYVTPTGSDSNSCADLLNACREISAALTKIDAQAIIYVAKGRYDPFTVTQSVRIFADTASLLNAGGTGSRQCGVTVVGTTTVRLSGFNFDTLQCGLLIDGGSNVHVEKSFFTAANGAIAAIEVRNNSPAEIYVADSFIDGDGGGGLVTIRPITTASAKVVFENVRMTDGQIGLTIDGTATSGAITVAVRNSTLSGNSTYGVYAVDSGGGSTNVAIDNTLISDMVNQGIVTSGANVKVRVANSTISHNGRGLQPAASSQIISQGGNVLAGNTVDGAFTATLPFK